jgi:hypothetical protein
VVPSASHLLLAPTPQAALRTPPGAAGDGRALGAVEIETEEQLRKSAGSAFRARRWLSGRIIMSPRKLESEPNQQRVSRQVQTPDQTIGCTGGHFALPISLLLSQRITVRCPQLFSGNDLTRLNCLHPSSHRLSCDGLSDIRGHT